MKFIISSIRYLKDKLNLKIGYSDHSLGSEASIAAVALGAKVIEKHITNDNKRKGPDHRFSAEPDVLREVVSGIKRVKLLRGSGKKKLTHLENENKRLGRRSAFSTRVINKGERLTNENFRFVRPGVGIPADSKQKLIGRILNKKLNSGSPINWNDLE